MRFCFCASCRRSTMGSVIGQYVRSSGRPGKISQTTVQSITHSCRLAAAGIGGRRLRPLPAYDGRPPARSGRMKQARAYPCRSQTLAETKCPICGEACQGLLPETVGSYAVTCPVHHEFEVTRLAIKKSERMQAACWEDALRQAKTRAGGGRPHISDFVLWRLWRTKA
jgi:hypothetical protein